MQSFFLQSGASTNASGISKATPSGASRLVSSFRPLPVPAAAIASDKAPTSPAPTHTIHVIPNNGRDAGRAIGGIPPVMGAHLMASGVVAPLSQSKGPGLDVAPHQFQYPGTEGDASVLLFFSKAGVAQGITRAVAEAADAAIAAKGAFTLVLSGGSLLGLLAGLADAKFKADWDKWHIFYVDERNVPHSSPDSTHGAALEAFLGKVPIPAANIHAIHENVPVEQAATQYAGQIISVPPAALPRTAKDEFPIFDLILLGMGPDGHVASLFPNKPQTSATSGWVLPVTNSPKPPPERITFTMPVINSAKDVVLVALGHEKAEVLQRVLEVQALPGALPAQLVRPTQGRLRVFLDVASAQNLDVTNWEDKKAYPRST